MAGSKSRTQIVNRAISLLRRSYDVPDDLPVAMEPVEWVLFATLLEDSDYQTAQQAMARLARHYVDWNEVRISTQRELEETLGKIPDVERKALVIIRGLRRIFEKHHDLTMSFVPTSKPKDVMRFLAKDAAFTAYGVALFMRECLDRHATPVDLRVRRVMTRLGVAVETATAEEIGASLTRLVPKSKGRQFAEQIVQLAEDVCREENPDCSNCVLVKCCTTGMERFQLAQLAARKKAASRARKEASKKT